MPDQRLSLSGEGDSPMQPGKSSALAIATRPTTNWCKSCNHGLFVLSPRLEKPQGQGRTGGDWEGHERSTVQGFHTVIARPTRTFLGPAFSPHSPPTRHGGGAKTHHAEAA